MTTMVFLVRHAIRSLLDRVLARRTPGTGLSAERQAPARAVAALEAIRERHPAAAVAIVRYGDVIRTVLAWALAMPLDAILRFEIGPASVSRLALGDGHPIGLSMNEAIGA